MLPLWVPSSFVPTDRTLHPEGLLIHAALLRQGFPHCAKFPTAASRRSMGRVSVPLWLIILSNQLLIVALVVHYTANKLIRCRLISEHRSFQDWYCNQAHMGY